MQFNSWHKKVRCCRFPYYDRHRQAPHRDTDKQSSPHPCRYTNNASLSLSLLCLTSFRQANKIGGFVVKGNPKIRFQIFNFRVRPKPCRYEVKKSSLNMQGYGLVCPDYFRLPYLSYGTFLPFFSPMKPDDDTDTILPIASTGFCAYLSSLTL